MPKIIKPDGKRPFRFASRAQYDKIRAREQGRRQDWSFTAKRARELRSATESIIEPDKAMNSSYKCSSCGLLFLAESKVLTTGDGRLHHASHLEAVRP